MNDSKPKQIPPYGIRIPADLKSRVQEAAEKNSRSLHGEIIHALEEKYPKPQVDLREHFERIAEEFYNMKDTAERRAYVERLDKALSEEPISDGHTMYNGAHIVAGNLIMSARIVAPHNERAAAIVKRK